MSYRFSAGIVYNNSPTAKQRQAIDEAAQAVLDVRVKYPVSSLADLYDPRIPTDLVKAHQKLDAAVAAAWPKEKFFSETELAKIYQHPLFREDNWLQIQIFMCLKAVGAFAANS